MKKASDLNVNTKFYWDDIYSNIHNKADYSVDTEKLDSPIHVGETFIYPSRRFSTAVSYIKEGDSVLDIGCGIGTFVRMVLDKFPMSEVWGVDISSKVIEKNTEKIPDGIFYQQYIGNMDKVPDNYFDIVFSGEVMEHLDDPSMLFNDAFTALKPGGKFITTTPNDKSVESQEHMWFITEEDVRELYEKAGFTNIQFIKLPSLEKMLILFAVGEKNA